MEAALHRVERVSASLDRLRGGLTSAVLAAEANSLMRAAAYLQLEVAHLFGLKRAGQKDLSPWERALDVAGRQIEVTMRGARARCEAEPSREQSASYKERAVAAVQALMPLLRECIRDEQARTPDLHDHHMSIRIYIGAGGQVTSTGPVDFSPVSGFTAELPYCATHVLEQARFPAPEGTAVMDVPFGN
jgi:hypothetical protein